MKIFVGYDSSQPDAYLVCKHSILKHNPHAEVIPLIRSKLEEAGIYSRPHDELSSTEFTFTRFLVPFLTDYTGWALFVDCDIVFNVDVQQLFDQADNKYAIMCVKHEYEPQEQVKMDGRPQTSYPRKNWSSVMLLNCAHPSLQALTPETINTDVIPGIFFHSFKWLEDKYVGELDHTWNYLVGVYNDIEMPNVIHYTSGGPWFEQWADCEFSEVWKQYKQEMDDK